MTDYKTKAFQENIRFLKEAYDKGTITRNEIKDNERSIRLIQFGKDFMKKEIIKEILKFRTDCYSLHLSKEDLILFNSYYDKLIKLVKKI